MRKINPLAVPSPVRRMLGLTEEQPTPEAPKSPKPTTPDPPEPPVAVDEEES